MENQGIVKVKFPRETDTKSGWTIDSSFLSRVRHSIPPDEDEWVPSHEEVQAVLMALEVIPAGIFTQPNIEQEPVAWRGYNWSHSPDDWVYRDFDDPILDGNGNNVGQPLYTTPPQRTWVGLTENEIKECFAITPDQYLPWHIYQRIEAKLKEKNT